MYVMYVCNVWNVIINGSPCQFKGLEWGITTQENGAGNQLPHFGPEKHSS